MKDETLIIEDNDQNLYLVTFVLEKHGYQVHAARDGMEGVARAATLRPDLILLDIQLPGMDGYTVARHLGEHPDLVSVPGDREKALEAGCTGYIEKPINPDTFMQQVEHHLNETTRKGGENHGPNTGR